MSFSESQIAYTGDPLTTQQIFTEDLAVCRVPPSVKITRSSQREGGVGFEVTVPAGSRHGELAEAYKLAVEFYRAFETDILGAKVETP